MKLDDGNGYSEDENDDDSVCENRQVQYLSEYPDPFGGTEEENIYEFIRKLEMAFYYNRVHSDNKVDILKKLVKGYAKYSVSDFKSLDENLKYLKKLFGNPRVIWKNEKDKFLQKSRQELSNWTDYFSPQRKSMLLKVANFLEYAVNLTEKFEVLKEDVFSTCTLGSIMGILPPKIIHRIIKKVRKEGGGVSNSLMTFNFLKEVVVDEIEVEIVASEYYDVYAESYAILGGQVRKDEHPESIKRSDNTSKKSLNRKPENETKNPKKLALRNLKRHFQRISKSIKAEKDANEMVGNYLKKSKLVMKKFKNVLSSVEMSRIQKKMDEVKIANDKMKA